MSAISNTALDIVKQRLNRLDTNLDSYLIKRIESAESELTKMTGALNADAPDDLMLLVDYSVWSYQNRDQPGNQPLWLRHQIRNRFLRTRGTTV